MNILGIESSCDDTSAAVLTDTGVQSNVIASQSIHIKFGGVVPELASRAHQKTITQTVDQALEEAGTGLEEIDLIAVTQGPGLMGSLLVGVCFAKGLSLSREIPIVGVNHMDAHIYANFIDEKPEFPFVCLTVSGGHTQLVLVKAPFEHEILGKTRDDAAGEAFDKIGKILGLPYPAGPVMDRLSKEGNRKFHTFPKSMVHDGLDFSFSGLKTSALYYLQDKSDDWKKTHLNDVCASISEAITEVLIKKLKRAMHQTGVQTIAIAGGVSANSMLREKAQKLASENKLSLHIPNITYCTDNAAMIAITGKMKAQLGEFDDLAMRPFASL
jgi:N6-L-threonylcarbamoyladenine synthase